MSSIQNRIISEEKRTAVELMDRTLFPVNVIYAKM